MRWLVYRSRVGQDLEDELQTFVDMAAADRVREGTAPADARRLAVLQLGGVEQAKERVRTARHGAWLDEIARDVRYAARMCARAPGFTVVVVLTLALGIGATTAIYSVVYGVLLRPLPHPEPDRIVAIAEVSSEGRPMRLADPNFNDFRDQSRNFQAIAKYAGTIASVADPSHAARAVVGRVSPGFLSVFRVSPIVGADFTDADTKKGAPPTALVSHGYWKQHLGGAQDLSQIRLKVEGAMVSVVGVLPPGFRFPADADLWMPADLEGESPSRTAHNYRAVARLADGVSVEQANRDVRAIARRIRDNSTQQDDYLLKDAIVMPLQASLTSTTRSPLLILMGAVGFLLLIACANVANLLLAQASARGRELALRSALGAGRGRLIGQSLAESSLLSAIVGDTHGYGLDAPPRPTVYVNLFQRPRPAVTLTILSDADARHVAAAAQTILHELDSEIPVRFRTLSQVYADSLGSRRFNAILIGSFGLAALALATAGVFGVTSYSVSRRTREIGVRVALGATTTDVLRMFLAQGLRTATIGVAFGIAAAFALTRTLASLLFGVTATDPPTFVGVTLLLGGASLLACYVPARRAMAVDPLLALRSD